MGDNKQSVEAHIATSCRLGRTLAFRLTFMENILAVLAPSPTTLQVYIGINISA